MGGADDGERRAPDEGVADEIQEAAIGLDGNHIERDEDTGIDGGTDDVFVVSVEDSQIVFRAVLGGGGDNLKPLCDKPAIDLGLGDGDEVEAGL